MFRITKRSKKSQARTGRLVTPHGVLTTPFFMPIATRGSVKSLDTHDLARLKTEIVLSNTYHLLLRPGKSFLERVGGLHTFMKWNKPLLTDSGGFQVFSLAKHRRITARGVTFKDPQTGSLHLLTPYNVIAMQKSIGSDIIMVLDECPPYPATRSTVSKAMERTSSWAKSSLAAYELLGLREKKKRPLLFAISQGGIYDDLRAKHAAGLSEMPFDGYAIGGLAVGESQHALHKAVKGAAAVLPVRKPRYLMGVGKPEDIVVAVTAGVDIFDCVVPTREARHGRIYAFSDRTRIRPNGSSSWYVRHTISQARYKTRHKPIDKLCRCPVCTTYTMSYLHHLFKIRDGLGLRLASQHNVYFYLELMRLLRTMIRDGRV